MGQELNSSHPAVPEAQESRKQPNGGKPRKWPAVLRRLARWLFAKPIRLLGVLPIAALIFVIVAPTLGSPAGMAVGSLEGVTEGLARGSEEGEAAGLSAEDTTAKIATQMTQTGKLEVLLLDIQLSDLYTEGTVPVFGGPQYAALFSLRGRGVFTVDLSQSRVVEGSGPDSIVIEIPHPQLEHYLDDSTIETVAEYKAPIFDGRTRNGYTGWLNSRQQIDAKVQTELIAYDVLLEQAEVSAQKQVELLAKAICGSAAAVEVRFIEEEG